MATDVDAVYVDWGQPTARRLGTVTAEELNAISFPAGSMGPKVAAATRFATRTGRRAAIGYLEDLEAIVRGAAGTNVVAEAVDAQA
jgi:carbamate kinase